MLSERSIVIGWVTVLSIGSACSGAALFVDDDAPGGDGTSWTGAMNDLQLALDAAAASGGAVTEVRVAQGTYVPTVPSFPPLPRSRVFRMINGVSLLGGFAGIAGVDPDERDPVRFRTSLSADVNGDDQTLGLIADNAYRVVEATSITASTRLDGFHLVNGNADGVSVIAGIGAAMTASGSNLVVSDCVIAQNRANLNGGAVSLTGGAPTFEFCVFEGNLAGESGGAVYAQGSSPTFVSCTFSENIGDEGAAFEGTGTCNPVFQGCIVERNNLFHSASIVEMAAGSLTLRGCTLSEHGPGSPLVLLLAGASASQVTVDSCSFYDNARTAISVVKGTMTVTDSTFERNGGAQSGGAIAKLNSADLLLLSSTFSENSSNLQGGAVYAIAGDLTIHACTFDDNVAPKGGAVYTTQSDVVEVFDSHFTGNQALGPGPRGGGVSFRSSIATVDNCSFMGNVTTGGGGGLEGEAHDAFIANCQFIDNEAGEGGGVWARGTPSLPPPQFLIDSCTFSGNYAFNKGGGASLDQCVMRSCTLTDNVTDGPGGGALVHSSSLIRSTFAGNAAARGGGLSLQYAVQAYACGFFGNSASVDGGGIYADGATVLLFDGIVSGNTSAQRGGALALEQSQTSVTNCTIVNNDAGTSGGAVHTIEPSITWIRNSVIWQNSVGAWMSQAAQIAGLPSAASQNRSFYSCVMGWDGSLGGIGNFGTDPQLVDPPGRDGIIGTADDDVRIQMSSPCVDAGANAAAPTDAPDLDADGILAEFAPLDYAGGARFRNVISTADSGCGVGVVIDVGAYELDGVGAQPRPGDISGDMIVNGIDLAMMLGQWGSYSSGCRLADLNVDGMVNGIDLGILLAGWG